MKNKEIITTKSFEKAKQLAKKLKKNAGIPHYEALDLASAIIGFSSWDQLVSVRKAAYSKFKNQSIIIFYDVSECVEDWRLLPAASHPTQGILKEFSKYWKDEGLSHFEMVEHIETQYDSFILNPSFENISLAQLYELVNDICFFSPTLIFINNELIKIKEPFVDVRILFNEYKSIFDTN